MLLCAIFLVLSVVKIYEIKRRIKLTVVPLVISQLPSANSLSTIHTLFTFLCSIEFNLRRNAINVFRSRPLTFHNSPFNTIGLLKLLIQELSQLSNSDFGKREIQPGLLINFGHGEVSSGCQRVEEAL